MASGLKTRLDYSDYVHIPPDRNRWEILDGEPYVTPAPSPLHQHFWVVDPEERRLSCYRAEADYTLVAAGEGGAAVAHPDWPDLTLRLGDLWR